MPEPRPTLPPLALRPSQYGVPPEQVSQRASELPGMTSRTIAELFPEDPPVIYSGPADLDRVRSAALEALGRVDVSRVQPGDTVNVVVSHSPLAMFGGKPMTEVLRCIRSEITERTGCRNVRLRVTGGTRFREQQEQLHQLGLFDMYEKRAVAVSALDRGVEIDTEVGPMWGLRKVYDGTWLFHVHSSDLRELHFHRMVDRALKPFAMSYARGETRSIFHLSMGPRSAMFVCRAIFQSEYVQSRFLGSCFLMVSPSGVIGVDADNDLETLSRRVTIASTRAFGTVFNLLGRIPECVAVLDAPMPVLYCTAAGIAYSNFVSAHDDLFDLRVGLPAYTVLAESLYGAGGERLHPELPPLNPAVRRCVQNHAWKGAPSAMLPRHIPTTVVGAEQASLFEHDSANPDYMRHAEHAGDLAGAVARARRDAGTDSVLIFDNALGGVNCSPEMAEFLDATAPQVAAEVSERLLPAWLAQRGIDMAEVPAAAALTARG